MQRLNCSILFAGLGTLSVMQPVGADPIPAHPNELKYPPLTYQLPKASEFREVLSNGTVIYLAEDRSLPTFDMTITIRVGSAVDPEGKAGLASLCADQMRDGGTKDLTPSELDEELAFLAASLNCRFSETSGRVSLSLLSKDTDAGIKLLVDVLRHPRFDQDRLKKAKNELIQNIKRRNDSTNSISRIEWGFLMNGNNHFSNRYHSSASIESVTREDLMGFHKRYVHPGNMILAVAGDFDRAEMLAKLEKLFADWPIGETGPMAFQKPNYKPKPGVYMVQKNDVNQGRVMIGHKSVERGSPDESAITIMNGILGASGFRSRLVARVRSDEGLAYNTGSRFQQGVYYPGSFRCYFQSKSESCAYATSIVLEEIKRMTEEKVSDEDVRATVAYLTESFPARFPTKMAILATYVSDEYTGRDLGYWQSYVSNLEKVTSDDVLRVAKKYLHPEELIILAVGEIGAIRDGGHDKAPKLNFDLFGVVHRFMPRDPDTMKR